MGVAACFSRASEKMYGSSSPLLTPVNMFTVNGCWGAIFRRRRTSPRRRTRRSPRGQRQSPERLASVICFGEFP